MKKDPVDQPKSEALREAMQSVTATLRRYPAFIFFVLLACVYGFVLIRINTLSNVSAAATGSGSGEVSITAMPHIDQSVVAQLQALKDNSVSVKALFDNARTNPFQE